MEPRQKGSRRGNPPSRSCCLGPWWCQARGLHFGEPGPFSILCRLQGAPTTFARGEAHPRQLCRSEETPPAPLTRHSAFCPTHGCGCCLSGSGQAADGGYFPAILPWPASPEPLPAGRDLGDPLSLAPPTCVTGRAGRRGPVALAQMGRLDSVAQAQARAGRGDATQATAQARAGAARRGTTAQAQRLVAGGVVVVVASVLLSGRVPLLLQP
jgi:hypothetical protein